jgi:hypothetical protein
MTQLYDPLPDRPTVRVREVARRWAQLFSTTESAAERSIYRAIARGTLSVIRYHNGWFLVPIEQARKLLEGEKH